jgi:GNAT superfamily N-acetyltransferase
MSWAWITEPRTIITSSVDYLIKQYPVESGALEIQYIEEYFGEFPRRKMAAEVMERLRDRDALILMAEAPLPDDPGTLVPVSYKVVHELHAHENVPKLRDLVERLKDTIRLDGRRVLYSWIGATRRDWRGQGHFRALTEESEVWAISHGFHEIVVKTKNRYYDMRSVLTQLQFDVIKYERNARDNGESKVYLSKLLPPELVEDHRMKRTVVHAE